MAQSTLRRSDDAGDGLDWSSLAILVAESSGRPLVLLDNRGEIRYVSRAMELALGWPAHELKGRRWFDLCGIAGAQAADSWIDEVLRGVLRSQRCEMLARCGSRLSLDVHLAVAGRGDEQGVLLSVESITPIDAAEGSLSDHDADYIVTRAGPQFGRLHYIDVVGRSLPQQIDGQKPCFRVLYERDTPCPHCPWLRPPPSETPAGGPWVAIRRRGPDDGFQVVSAEPLDDQLGRVRIRNVSDVVLGAIHEAKVRVLADKARLSDRERSVLDYLRMGRSLDEIASILGLSRRTVKFHQANILQKLGADSRFHLMSLATF